MSGAASSFTIHQMPEFYSGLQRDSTNFSVQYLGANVPQAGPWGPVSRSPDDGRRPKPRFWNQRVRRPIISHGDLTRVSIDVSAAKQPGRRTGPGVRRVVGVRRARGRRHEECASSKRTHWSDTVKPSVDCELLLCRLPPEMTLRIALVAALAESIPLRGCGGTERVCS